ncbi:MAG: DUF5713 family protein [Methanobacteriaceae archaeon]|jgi:hypothetical protein|nr:DUF5713 family protein [Candidatus Methanorudis spinitermitis]
MEKFNEKLYLVDMYEDGFFPNFLVDKIKVLLISGVELLEDGEKDIEIIQKKFDEITIGINNLEEEFGKNDSELETGARESIGETVDYIINHFNLSIDVEKLIRERNW